MFLLFFRVGGDISGRRKRFPTAVVALLGRGAPNSWTLPGRFPDASRTLPGRFLDTYRTLPGHFPDASRTLPRHFPNASRTLSGRFPNASRTLPRRFPDASRTLLRRFPDARGRSRANQQKQAQIAKCFLMKLGSRLSGWGLIALPLPSALSNSIWFQSVALFICAHAFRACVLPNFVTVSCFWVQVATRRSYPLTLGIKCCCARLLLGSLSGGAVVELLSSFVLGTSSEGACSLWLLVLLVFVIVDVVFVVVVVVVVVVIVSNVVVIVFFGTAFKFKEFHISDFICHISDLTFHGIVCGDGMGKLLWVCVGNVCCVCAIGQSVFCCLLLLLLSFFFFFSHLVSFFGKTCGISTRTTEGNRISDVAMEKYKCNDHVHVQWMGETEQTDFFRTHT